MKRVSNPSSNAQFGDILRPVSRRRVLQGSLGAVTLACLGETRETLAQGSGDFFAIITNFGNSPRANAFLDVSSDTFTTRDGTEFFFNVFDSNGLQLAEFTLKTKNGFVSTASATAPNDNLFTLSNGGPALIKARTPGGASNTTAELNQSSQGNRLVIGIPPARRQDGTPLAVGSRFPIINGAVSSSTILVANVSGTDVTVDIFVGTKGADGTGKYSITRLKPNSVGRLDLTADDANSHLVLSATGDIVAQIVIDDGKPVGVTCIPA